MIRRLIVVLLILSVFLPMTNVSSALAAGESCNQTHNCILTNYKEDCSNSSNPPPQWTVSYTVYRWDGLQYVFYMAHNGASGQYRYYQKWTGNYAAGSYWIRISTPNGWSTGWVPLTVSNNGNWVGSFTQVRTC